jgi:hypothetical protein
LCTRDRPHAGPHQCHDSSPGETAGAWWENTGAVRARVAAAKRSHYTADFDVRTYFLSPNDRRLFDEMVPVPTRKVSIRLTVTYAGFEGESALLEGLYKRGLKGEQIAPALYRQDGLLMFWAHDCPAPWQTEQWIEQMRQQLRPNQFLRMIENRWVTSESTFVPMEWWDACVDQSMRPVLSDQSLPLWVGLDASLKRDSTAIVAVTFDRETNRCEARLPSHLPAIAGRSVHLTRCLESA